MAVEELEFRDLNLRENVALLAVLKVAAFTLRYCRPLCSAQQWHHESTGSLNAIAMPVSSAGKTMYCMLLNLVFPKSWLESDFGPPLVCAAPGGSRGASKVRGL